VRCWTFNARKIIEEATEGEKEKHPAKLMLTLGL
jgi:hypothetical protein